MQVSVIIPVYNGGGFLQHSVASVLAHACVQEVLLVDDGSTDGSRADCLLWAARDARIRVLHHPDDANHGVSATRNLGIRSATMPYVAFLDADDEFLPDRFDADRAIFEQDPKVDGVYNALGVKHHSDKGKLAFDRTFKHELTTIRHQVDPDRLFDAFIGLHEGIENVGHFSLDCLTVRRAALARMPRLLREDLSMHEDSEFILRMSYHLRLAPGNISTPVALRGVHDANRITNDPDKLRSRIKHFEALHEWAIAEGMAGKVIGRFRTELVHLKLMLAVQEGRKLKALGLLVGSPGNWKRLDSVHAVIGGLMGQHSLPAKWFREMTAWMYGWLRSMRRDSSSS